MHPHIFRYEISPHIYVYLDCTGVLYSKQSRFQKIEVVESLDFGKLLVLDGIINLTERDEFIYHEMIVHVPLFSHPNPAKVLIIGGGDGGAARETLKHKEIETVQQVEIDREVIDVSKKYFPSLGLALEDPKVSVFLMDAMQYMKEIKEKFDIILVDSTDPVIEQSGGLFGLPFYKDCFNALTEQGILATHVGDSFFEKNLVLDVFNNLKKVFPIVKIYCAPVPSYTLIPYSFAFCSKSVLPEMRLGLSRFSGSFQTKYFNPAIHQAAFALPEYLRKDFAD